VWQMVYGVSLSSSFFLPYFFSCLMCTPVSTSSPSATALHRNPPQSVALRSHPSSHHLNPLPLSHSSAERAPQCWFGPACERRRRPMRVRTDQPTNRSSICVPFLSTPLYSYSTSYMIVHVMSAVRLHACSWSLVGPTTVCGSRSECFLPSAPTVVRSPRPLLTLICSGRSLQTSPTNVDLLNSRKKPHKHRQN
jgi:hypothetical protein